jgi:hypothetical protein
METKLLGSFLKREQVRGKASLQENTLKANVDRHINDYADL